MSIRSFNCSRTICLSIVISFPFINPPKYGHGKETEADSSLNSEAAGKDFGLV